MALVMAGGAVLSFSPEMISMGPRSGFLLSALASVNGLRLAVAAWNSGVPEADTAKVACSTLRLGRNWQQRTRAARADSGWTLTMTTAAMCGWRGLVHRSSSRPGHQVLANI